MPLVLTHGWPWTFWDYHKVIRPLSDPAAFGGDAADAFEVVVPSLPGFGFSTPLAITGVDFTRTADLWVGLMRDALGHERFGAAGGDWGALISAQLGHAHADRLTGVHLSLSLPLDLFHGRAPARRSTPRTSSTCCAARARRGRSAPATARCRAPTRRRSRTRCTTRRSASAPGSSSAGATGATATATWSGASRRTTSSPRRCSTGSPRASSHLPASTGRRRTAPWAPVHDRSPVVEAPTGVAMFPRELSLMPRSFLERYYDLRRITTMPAGGHFAPMEEPDLLVEDIRAFFRPLRETG
jgi:pimeloyl-ACP methyl ester carboxylesterase